MRFPGSPSCASFLPQSQSLPLNILCQGGVCWLALQLECWRPPGVLDDPLRVESHLQFLHFLSYLPSPICLNRAPTACPSPPHSSTAAPPVAAAHRLCALCCLRFLPVTACHQQLPEPACLPLSTTLTPLQHLATTARAPLSRPYLQPPAAGATTAAACCVKCLGLLHLRL